MKCRDSVVVLAFLVLNSTQAQAIYPTFCDKNITHWGSQSCWQPQKDSSHQSSRFQLSQKTLSRMNKIAQKTIVKDYEYIGSVIEELLKFMVNNQVEIVSFLYDYNETLGVEHNSDCKVYKVSDMQDENQKKHIYTLGEEYCDKEVVALAILYGRAVDSIRQTKVFGFEKPIWSKHPTTKVAQTFEQGTFSEEILIVSFHDVPKRLLDEFSGSENVSNIRVATVKYQVRAGESWSTIAKKLTGSADNWTALWALNKGSKDSNELASGAQIDIFSSIQNWSSRSSIRDGKSTGKQVVFESSLPMGLKTLFKGIEPEIPESQFDLVPITQEAASYKEMILPRSW